MSRSSQLDYLEIDRNSRRIFKVLESFGLGGKTYAAETDDGFFEIRPIRGHQSPVPQIIRYDSETGAIYLIGDHNSMTVGTPIYTNNGSSVNILTLKQLQEFLEQNKL